MKEIIMRWHSLLLLLIFILLNGCASLQGTHFKDSFFSSEPLVLGKLGNIFDEEQPTLPTKVELKELPTGSEAITVPQQAIQSIPAGEQMAYYPTETDYPIETTMADASNVLSSYHLDSGDLISIKVFGENDFSLETRLSDAGTISYPFLGELQLAGLSAGEVEELITSGLDRDYLINPKVTVTILEHRKFFVNGEVKEPGGYAYIPGLTINKAISLAGGFTEQALREKLFIIRDGSKTPQIVALGSLVQPGDIVLIKESFFFVNGEIQKPGRYTYARDLTVNKAISLAGGFTERADRDKIYIIHEGHDVASAAALGTYIQPGDVLVVKDSFF
jgi:polysaccharide export outer membrane protein